MRDPILIILFVALRVVLRADVVGFFGVYFRYIFDMEHSADLRSERGRNLTRARTRGHTHETGLADGFYIFFGRRSVIQMKFMDKNPRLLCSLFM